ncbi:MAG: hypothetical protein V2B18_19585 [Pseudomonadota bacterium]
MYRHYRILTAVFLSSVAVVGWQLVLMRCFLIARYHHFSFLVISCALLGFGAGGTILSLRPRWFEHNSDRVIRRSALCFGISMPLALRLGETLPLSVYFAPDSLLGCLGWWALFWLIHLLPFLFAGILIGLVLTVETGRVHLVYAANLGGSAVGSLTILWLMSRVSPAGLVIPLCMCVIAACVLLMDTEAIRTERGYTACLGGAAVLLWAACLTPVDRLFPLRIDEYKDLAHLQRLVDQGAAKLERSLWGPRGRIDRYSSDHFHGFLSTGGGLSPPKMDVVTVDGFQAGAVITAEGPEADQFLLSTLGAMPYKLIRPRRILILGERGTVHLRTALLSKAETIVFVQPDKNVIDIIASKSGGILRNPRVQAVQAESRAFLDRCTESFDIIHLAELEGFAPGSGGIGGLKENYLATVEGFSLCLDVLNPGGLASTVRGIQFPHRDNMRIGAGWIEALEARRSPDPGACLLMARDELGYLTMTAKEPIPKSVVAAFSRICDQMSWDLEWGPGIGRDMTNRVHLLPGPAGESISWFRHAMEKFVSPERKDFYGEWVCDIRPATDNRPFFHDFFKWRSLDLLRDSFGPMWPAAAEMGFLVLIVAAVWTAVIAGLLLLFPLVFVKSGAPTHSYPMLPMLGYFGALGAGFMLLEMAFIQIYSRILGDPVSAAALVVGGFLLFAGVGSLVQPRVTRGVPGGVLTVACVIAVMVIVYSSLINPAMEWSSHFSDSTKAVLALIALFPPAFLMGFPFAWGMAAMHGKARRAVPLAWAVNGYASVTAAPGAVLAAMTFGFSTLLAIAAACYVVAGLCSIGLVSPDRTEYRHRNGR